MSFRVAPTLPRTARAANADYNAAVISVEEALAAIDRETAALGSEPLPVAEAGGRVLSRTVRSDVDWPPFDTSAMDGYAVLLADAAGPGASVSERPGTVAAGDAPPEPLAPGEAVRVMTGVAEKIAVTLSNVGYGPFASIVEFE